MPQPRKYKDSADRYQAFLDDRPDYRQEYEEKYRQEHGDRLREIKRNWARKQAAERSPCPTCKSCGAKLKSDRTRAEGVCSSCRARLN